ncbi:hypothetical protein [Cytobacillus sp. SAFR-174]
MNSTNNNKDSEKTKETQAAASEETMDDLTLVQSSLPLSDYLPIFT